MEAELQRVLSTADLIDLVNDLADQVCDPDRKGFEKPFWSNGRVALTDGSIAFVFDCEEKAWDTPRNEGLALRLFNVVDAGFKPIGLTLPEIQCNPKWENPFEKITAKCDECSGTGIAERNLGHEHVCKNCNGEGSVQYSKISHWNSTKVPLAEKAVYIAGVGYFDKRYLWMIQQLAKRFNLQYGVQGRYQRSFLYASFEGGKACVASIFCREIKQ
jgi:hypothetical protein